MARSALPQNFLISSASDIDLTSIAGWTPCAGCARTLDAIHPGVNIAGSTSMWATKACLPYGDMSPPLNDVIELRVWVYDATKVSNIRLYYTPDPSYTQCYFHNFAASELVTGENILYIKPFYGTGTAVNWTLIGGILPAPQKEIRIYASFSAESSVTFMSITRHKCRATVIFTFDDAYLSDYTEAYPYMKARGVRGCSHVPHNEIGNTNHMTLAQLKELYADGWGIGNHTMTHRDLTALDDATVVTEVSGMANYLIENDMPLSAWCLVYPAGGNNANVQALVASAGVLCARGTQGGPSYYPHPLMNEESTVQITSTYTLAQAIAAVERGVVSGGAIWVMVHELVTSDPTGSQWTNADFEALVDYCISRNLRFLLPIEFYRGLTNPRYRSLPMNP